MGPGTLTMGNIHDTMKQVHEIYERFVGAADRAEAEAAQIRLMRAGISDLPALDGPFIHPKAAQRPKLLFVTASSRFRGRQLSPW